MESGKVNCLILLVLFVLVSVEAQTDNQQNHEEQQSQSQQIYIPTIPSTVFANSDQLVTSRAMIEQDTEHSLFSSSVESSSSRPQLARLMDTQQVQLQQIYQTQPKQQQVPITQQPREEKTQTQQQQQQQQQQYQNQPIGNQQQTTLTATQQSSSNVKVDHLESGQYQQQQPSIEQKQQTQPSNVEPQLIRLQPKEPQQLQQTQQQPQQQQQYSDLTITDKLQTVASFKPTAKTEPKQQQQEQIPHPQTGPQKQASSQQQQMQNTQRLSHMAQNSLPPQTAQTQQQVQLQTQQTQQQNQPIRLNEFQYNRLIPAVQQPQVSAPSQVQSPSPIQVQTQQPQSNQPQSQAKNQQMQQIYRPSYMSESMSPLYLGHNPFIEILRPQTYADDNIVTLNLSHSHIYEIDSEAFVGQRFEHIDLSNNKLGLIHSRSFRIGPIHSRHNPFIVNGNNSKSVGSSYPTRRPPPAHPKSVTIDFSHNPAIVALSGAFDHIDVPNCLLNFTNSTVELKFGAFKKYFKEHPGHLIDIESVDCCEQEWLLGYKHNFLPRTRCDHDPNLLLSKMSQQQIIDSCISYVTAARHNMNIQGPSVIHYMAASAPRAHSNSHMDNQNFTYLILGGTAMILTSLSIYIIFYMFSLKAAFVYQMQNKN